MSSNDNNHYHLPTNGKPPHHQEYYEKVDDDIEQQQQQSHAKNLKPFIFIINENSKLLPRHNTTTGNDNNSYYATICKDDDDTKSTGKESSSSTNSLYSHGSVIKKEDNNMDQARQSLVCYNYNNLGTLLKDSWNWYDTKLQTHPVVTKSITAAIIVCAGDFCGQSIEHSLSAAAANEYYDLSRSFRFFLVGGLIQAPITHYYLDYLDYKLPPTPSPWTSITIYKLLIDQLLFAPIFTIIIMIFLDTLQGLSWEEQLLHLQNEYITTMIANWKLWIPAIFFNFAFCPPKLRVLYNNVVFFVWSICLSLLLNTTSTTAAAAAASTR